MAWRVGRLGADVAGIPLHCHLTSVPLNQSLTTGGYWPTPDLKPTSPRHRRRLRQAVVHCPPCGPMACNLTRVLVSNPEIPGAVLCAIANRPLNSAQSFEGLPFQMRADFDSVCAHSVGAD